MAAGQQTSSQGFPTEKGPGGIHLSRVSFNGFYNALGNLGVPCSMDEVCPPAAWTRCAPANARLDPLAGTFRLRRYLNPWTRTKMDSSSKHPCVPPCLAPLHLATSLAGLV